MGFAHLGVLRVLEAHGIPVDCVAGTSAGSLVGAFLAAGLTADTMWQIGKNLTWAKIGGITLPTKGLLDSRMLQRFVEQRIGEREIGMLKLPYAAASVDLLTGEEVDWFEGKVGEAVRASCIIPGVFTPFEKAGRVLVDGGFRKVFEVVEGSPADGASIREDDLILFVDRQDVRRMDFGELHRLLTREGETVELFMERDGERFEVKFRLERLI